MAAITSYTTLLAAIKSEAEDDGTEFTAFLPTAIDLAEERLYKELDLPQLENQKDTGTLAPNVRQVTKPATYKTGAYFAVIVNNERIVLKKKTESFIADYWPVDTDTGTPKYYCDETDTQFIIAPTPPSGVNYEIKYTAKPTKLSASNETNYYTNNCVESLFLATMAEISKFMKAWSQNTQWEEDFQRVQEAWNVEAARYRRDEGTLPSSPSSGPNSIKHTYQSAS